MRTMDRADFRVLAAVESGMKDHALVPLPLINSIAGLRHGGSHKIVSSLLRDKLLSHERKGGMDGYRLTNAGYDILALHNLKSRGFVAALGQKIGTGKESDIYLAANNEGKQIVLKFHRLGRTSFRNVRKKRDYFNNNKSQQATHSWLFLSRLSALKEFAFMKALYNVQYPTPTPMAHNRHIVAMSLVRGVPLYQIFPKQLSVAQAASIYEQSIHLARRLAQQHGLVHCDLNEFNLLVDLSGIQALATDDGNDPYVRHSGQSVAPEQSIGALSKPAWEQTLEEEHHTTNKEEALPEPAARLPTTGEPKPIVTLIDFPQMISTQHPNAQEYYERDIACLRRFFVKKLQCQIPEDDEATRKALWENVVKSPTTSRLDEDLRASGYTEDIVNNNELELYYFEAGPRPIGNSVAVDEEEEEEEEHDDDDDDDDDSSNDDEDGSNGSELDVTEEVPIADQETPKLDRLDDVEDDQSLSVTTEARMENLSLLESDELQSMTRAKLEVLAKERVRRQFDRRKSRQKGAFRKGNSNKTFVKGKRVLSESLKATSGF